MDDNSLNAPATSPDDVPAAPTSPSPDDAASSKPLNLTPEQLDALGLVDCAPGEAYTVELKCTGNDPETGPLFEAEPAEPSGEEADEADKVSEAAPDETGAEDGIASFTRKKKEPRAGLPDTKSMRNI